MLKIGTYTFASRLFTGTGKFRSNEVMVDAIKASGSELVTVALRRVDLNDQSDGLIHHLYHPNLSILPNTSGVRDAREAVFSAQLAREALETNLIKLEIHPDPRYLLPDAEETLKATEELAKDGFVVLPYIQADPVLCKKLEDAGTAAVMPLGSPIGSNKGLRTKDFLNIIIEESQVPVVVDAGIAEALEMGAYAVLVNTAIAVAGNPVEMAKAFKLSVEAGRKAFEARLGKQSDHAISTSPLTSFLDQ